MGEGEEGGRTKPSDCIIHCQPNPFICPFRHEHSTKSSDLFPPLLEEIHSTISSYLTFYCTAAISAGRFIHCLFTFVQGRRRKTPAGIISVIFQGRRFFWPFVESELFGYKLMYATSMTSVMSLQSLRIILTFITPMFRSPKFKDAHFTFSCAFRC